MSEVTIRSTPNGPYLIEGSIELYDTAGTKVPTEGRAKIALCRCGASSNKPFQCIQNYRLGPKRTDYIFLTGSPRCRRNLMTTGNKFGNQSLANNARATGDEYFHFSSRFNCSRHF